MPERIFTILGGYGNAGRTLAKVLLQQTSVRLRLAGRKRERAEALAAELNQLFAGDRVQGVYADAADPASLKRACEGVDLLLVASSTARHAREVATSALETGVDYLDIQYSASKISALKSLSGEILRAGRCFITDGGFHPGLPAVMVRYAAPFFDRLEKALVGSLIRVDWKSLDAAESTVREFLELIMEFEALHFKEGQWRRAKKGMGDAISMDFGGEFGKQYCVPMFLEEMRSLPESYPSLEETGFFVSGFNWFVDLLVLPLAMLGLKVWPRQAARPLGRLMYWGLKTFSRLPYGTMLRLQAEGERKGKTEKMVVGLYHPDGYLFTAIPVAATLLQYLDGSIRKPGLWTQANLVDPGRLMADMQRMGIDVQTEEKQGRGEKGCSVRSP